MLELGQILKGVDAFQLARVNQTHEEIADVRAVRRLEEERVFSVENRFLQASFDDGMPPAELCRVRPRGRGPRRETECVSLGQAA